MASMQHHADAPATDAQNTGRFVSLDSTSSLYAEVSRELLKRGWSRASSAASRCHLCFGERNGLKYNKLGLHDGVVPVVNYYRGNDKLCRKVAMLKLLRAWHTCSELTGVPSNEDERNPSAIMTPTAAADETKGNHADVSTTTPAAGVTAIAQLPWVPESYIVRPPEKADERLELNAAHAAQPRPWIAKPSHGGKGDGIIIDDDVHRLLDEIDRRAAEGETCSYMVSAYILNPLLLVPGERKFDVRLWVILDSHFVPWVYNEGVVRTASVRYTVGDWAAAACHLTNHCVQEALAEDFGRFEPGNEMFFDQFADFIATVSEGQVTLQDNLLPQLHRIIASCVAALHPHSALDSQSARYRSVQVLGFDFMFDADYQPWLLEVNGAPALAERLRVPFAKALLDWFLLPLVANPEAEVPGEAHQVFTQAKSCEL